LEEEHLIERDENIRIDKNDRSILLYKIIMFCINNKINYNLMLKNTMVEFILQAAKQEFFTIKDININPRTFRFYTTALSKYGLLLISSRKPLKCKLLRHSFFKDLFKFYDRQLKFYTPQQHSFQSEIKTELRKYKQNLKINYSIIDDLEQQQEVDFIYSSLHLEGNPLTLPETQKLILDEIVPEKYKLSHIQEVINYKNAVDLMINKAKRNEELSLALILEYHQLAMSHIHGAGQIRQQHVRIKGNPGFKKCEWRLIPKRIKDLLEEYSSFRGSKNDIGEVIGFSSYFHNEFQRIHPFIDGNSRISRLLMLHILRANAIPVLDLPLGYFDLYMDLTKRSNTRDDEAFKLIVEEIIYFSLKKLNS
jgi:fido (protein-threonine AMPylation protein)